MPRKSKIRQEPVSAMLERPTLAVYIARIATGWSEAEQRLGALIIQLLGAHAHTGMKMYRALSGAGSQKAVLRAVAQDRLSSEMVQELEGILSNYKKAGSRRNAVVHGKWEISDEHPDSLVWTDSADHLLASSEFWAGWHSQADEMSQFDWARGFKGQHPPKLLYGEQDFEEILDQIRLAINLLMAFNLRCTALNKAGGNEASMAPA